LAQIDDDRWGASEQYEAGAKRERAEALGRHHEAPPG
jgi:hypothetical protein